MYPIESQRMQLSGVTEVLWNSGGNLFVEKAPEQKSIYDTTDDVQP